ncbi:response regulator transcription factor [Evansella sp. AB-P1]|uniref:response regulator transcription factor n=1 Tax=Evansella sp. AB-P1 TaxID=3037653 RepID=UPI00242042BA|nr:response regulator transcription factor [Evansella sp. AB-P1]MDG5789444.1 response regulator transcription factor [Evansella sp. AB-P1]
MESDETLKIFITDDDIFFRSGIELVINAEKHLTVVGSAGNGKETLEKIKDLQPDVILIDIKMPMMNGIECIRKLKLEYPHMYILILTTFNEEEFIIEGLANGANGYLIKGIDFINLVNTIQDVVKGQYILPAEVASKLATYLVNTINKQPKLPEFIYSNNTFTIREQKIMSLLVERYTNKEIADNLSVSVGTLKNYLTVIYEKLQVKNRQEAAALLRNR